MKKNKIYFLGTILLSIVFSPSCDDCTVQPDLISDLAAPTTDIIVGEPVDWDYVVESVEDNSQDCDILKAIASIGKIVIDFFVDQNDNQGDLVLNNQNNINALNTGQSQTVTNTIDVFNDEGIYMIAVNADDTDVVDERNEGNNSDNAEVDTRSSSQSDLFANASDEFKEKLANTAALVIVGRNFNGGNKIYSYKGKPIYYAE